MGTALLGIVMDLVVLVALGATLYYTIHLTKGLKAFKTHREAMQGLIGDLSQNIDSAQRAIENLKKTSNMAAQDLEGVLFDAKKMAAELRLINQTSDSLAGRLEKLAGESRNKVVQAQNGFLAPELSGGREDEAPFQAPSRAPRAAEVRAPSFFIQDRDFAEDEPMESWQDEPAQNFSSQAEKDLYEALQKNKGRSGGGHF